MTNLIIASYPQEAEATTASQKLHELESIGDITIYELVVITKNADEETQVLEAVDAEGGATTLSGMAVGALVGALGGPVGMALGMVTGTFVGAAAEADDYGFEADFVSHITGRLQPGMTVVIAEIEEEDPVFVDSTLGPLGGYITHTSVDYEYTKYSDAEVDELDEDIRDARAKLKKAADEDKDKIRKKIGRLKEKRKDLIADFKEKVKEAETEIKTSVKDRKLEKIRSKIEKHQNKIADLEKKLQGILEKHKEEPEPVKEPETGL